MFAIQKSSSSIGVLIASYRRPDELRKVLEAVANSSCDVKCVVIVDASPLDVKPAVERVVKESALKGKIHLLHSERASLCHQRNLGIRELQRSGVDLVQILDDDTSPTPDYIAKLSQVMSAHPGAIGASGLSSDLIDNNNKTKIIGKFVYWLVGLEAYRSGSVSRAGCGIPADVSGPDLQKVDWLFGCSMWSIRVFDTLSYLDELPGSGLFEDVYFSIRASQIGELYVSPSARLEHTLSDIGRPDLDLYSYRFSRNRWFVARAHHRPRQTAFWFMISVAFLTLVNLSKSFHAKDQVLRSQYRTAALRTLQGAADAVRQFDPR